MSLPHLFTGTTLTGFCDSMSSMMLCRLLVGGGSAGSMTGSQAYISDLSDKAPEHRARIMVRLQCAVCSGVHGLQCA